MNIFSTLARTLALSLSLLVTAPTLAYAHDMHPENHAPKVGADAPTAFGREGTPSKASRTIIVEMSDDMRFSPSSLTVTKGETVRLHVMNRGGILHELVLGTSADITRHQAAMRAHPGMAHEAPYMAHVDPGTGKDIVWEFTESGEFDFACLLPGHYEAGMKGQVQVR